MRELLWRRALEEARERFKMPQSAETSQPGSEEIQEQVGRLSVALAEARASEGEQLAHVATLSKERDGWRTERTTLLALLKSTQCLLQHSNARVDALQRRDSSVAPRARQSWHVRRVSKRRHDGAPRSRLAAEGK